MTSWATHIAADSRRWCLIARIEGVGRYLTSSEVSASVPNGMYRFCTAVPDYVGSATEPSDLWKPVLATLERLDDAEAPGPHSAELPDILAEELKPEGGIADRSASVRLSLLDEADFLTSLLKLDVAAVTSLTAPTAAATTLITAAAAGAARLVADSLCYVNGEAMRVVASPGSSGSASINVTRGALGTTATPHPAGSQVYTSPPFLGGRRLTLHVAPLDGDSVGDEQLVGRYVVDGIEWDEGLNVWQLDARAEVEAFEATLPEAPWTATGAFLNGPADAPFELAIAQDGLPSDGWGSLHLLGRGEVVRATDNGTGIVALFDERGIAGTRRARPSGERTVITRVLVPDPASSDFRSSPGGSPSTSRSSGTWDEIFDPIGILLCILTSSRAEEDGLELVNYTGSYGNFSALPVGYGLGIPAADIDWDSALEVRDRLPDVRLHNLVLGKDPKKAVDWIDENILRPVQVHLVLSAGAVRFVKVRAPLAGQTLTAIDADAILVRGEGDDQQPDVRITRDLGTQARRVEFKVGPEDVPAVAQVANPTRTRRTVSVPVPGGTTTDGQLQVWQGFATALARQAYRPRAVASMAVDASLWATVVGELAEVTFPEAPDLQAGTRGWSSHVAQVLYREVRADTERGVWLQTRLRVYNDGQLAKRICPAAWVQSVVDADATCKANRFTDSDATGGLPTQDVAAFTVGDVVRLVDPDGVDAGAGGTETVDAIDTGTDTITLSGTFSGNLAAGTLLVYADGDDAIAAQYARSAWLAEGDFRVGTGDGDPTYYEEA